VIEIDQVLENCLNDLASGASNLDECLARHPEQATQLKPLLQAALYVGMGSEVHPSPAFKSRTRAKLTLHMDANPRRKARSGFVFWRLATNLAMALTIFLAAGTVYAQGVLPGSPFYGWKLTSEQLWRAVSPDPVSTDLALANRRIDEMNAVINDPALWSLAMEGYQEVLTRLESELDAGTLEQILPQVATEQPPVENLGPLIPTTLPLDSTVTPIPELPLNETTVPAPANTNVPLPSLPNINPTKLPEIIPTIDIPPLLP